MGDAPTLATSRLTAVPLTLWNAGLAAEDLAPMLSPGHDGIGQLRTDLRAELRRRATGPADLLTWMLRDGNSAAVGMLAVDVRDRTAVTTVTVAPRYRRGGYAAEVVPAVASWLESRWRLLVEARITPGDAPAEGLAAATGFVPTDLVRDGRRSWLRTLAHV